MATCLAAAVLAPAVATPSPGPVDPASSTVVASPTSVPADATTISTITVTLKDTAGNPVPGRLVRLDLVQYTGAVPTFGPSSTGSNISGVAGVASFSAHSAAGGSATFQAFDLTDNVLVTQTATVGFTSTVVDPHSGPITIDAVSPDHGPTLGRAITITGPGVGTATSVSFGGASVPVYPFHVISATRIDIFTPEVTDAATVDLRVVNNTGPSPAVPYTFVAPTAGHWAITTPLHHDMPYVESHHDADSFLVTPLRDGTVLVVGMPRSGDGPLPTWAEVYDPTAGSWSTCSAANARSGCPAQPPSEFVPDTATVVEDGRVLVSGAVPDGLSGPRDPRSVQGAAYLYDPATGTWHDAGQPLHSVYTTATLLSGPGCEPSCGKVLVAGGFAGARGEIGCGATSPFPIPTCTAELYDPAANTWAFTGSMAHRRERHRASLMAGGGVMVTGGMDSGGAVIDTAEIYHPATGSWSEARPFTRGRESHGIAALPGGGVMVVGGYTAQTVNPTATAELYNPGSDSWSFLGLLNRPRAGGSVVLAGGRAMVVGGGSQPFHQGDRPDNTAEIYDPTAIDAATGKAGAWDYVVPMLDKLRFPVAVALADRRVLVVGAKGQTAEVGAELFSPGPVVTSLSPVLGPKGGGTVVTLRGTDLDGASAVRFGDVTVGPDHITQVSPTEVRVVTPPASGPGPVPVTVTTTIGDSSPSPTAVFTYYGTPGTVANPNATATAPGEITVSFDAAGSDGDAGPPVGDYQIRQSPSPIDATTFDTTRSVCEVACHLPAAAVGQRLALPVGDLDPGTTYHYAIRAVGADGQLGPVSADVAATTAGSLPCPVLAAVAGQVLYPSGYSLVGLPQASVVGANSPLYGWFDQGAGGAYATATSPTAGRGYWAWFSCPRAVTPATAGPTTVSLPLGAYHASMVGNPSPTAPARLSGQDFAARWDQRANNGAGGYRISAYRAAQSLAVGEGAWAFSYTATNLFIEPAG